MPRSPPALPTTDNVAKAARILAIAKAIDQAREESAAKSAVAYTLQTREMVYFFINYTLASGIHAAFAAALREHARCAHCGAPPAADFRRCQCGTDAGVFMVNQATWRSKLGALRRKDRHRLQNRKSRARRQRVIRNSPEPSYTRGDIAILRDVQEDVCYYCGTSIRDTAQVEHLQPLALGGSDGMSNIMLSCPYCNGAKGATAEDAFWRTLKRQLSPVEFRRRREAAKLMQAEKLHRLIRC